MNRRSPLWRILALLGILALFAAACGDDDDGETSTADTSAPAGDGEGEGVTCEGVSLGFFGALTGDAANLGININQGARLAVDQFNEENPDCQVGYEELDSQGSEDQAPALAQEAIQNEEIVGLIGPCFSGESRAANPIFEEAGMPLVTPSATAVDLTEQDWTVFHRALANDGFQGPAIANYIVEELGAETVAVIDDASEYGKGIGDIVRETLAEAGATVGTSDSIDPTSQDYSSTVTAIESEAPDAVFYGGYYEAAGRFAKQLADAGVESTFVAGDGVLDPGFVEAAGDAAAEGAVISCPCAPSPEEFKTAYVEAWDVEPGTYAPESYDAANTYLQAISEGNTDRESINEYLDSVEYEGITKTLKFAESGELEGFDSVFAYQVEGGEITGGDEIGN